MVPKAPEGAGSRRKQQDDAGPQHGLGVVIVNIAEEGDQCFGHLGRDDLAEQFQQLAGIDAGAADDAGHADEQREKAEHQVVGKCRRAAAHAPAAVQVQYLIHLGQKWALIDNFLQELGQGVPSFLLNSTSRRAPPPRCRAAPGTRPQGGKRRPLRLYSNSGWCCRGSGCA